MDNYSIAIGSACFGLSLTMSGISFFIKKSLGKNPMRPIKPFDCHFCMAFWTGLISSVIVFDKNIIEAIFIGSMASIISVFIDNLLNKKNNV